MTNSSENENIEDLPAWGHCDYFCIHAYAVTGTARCGWRGQSEQVLGPDHENSLICPRCGNASLFRIPRETDGFE
jgi:hypothetical protein